MVATWQRATQPVRQDLIVIDRATGERRELTDGDALYAAPAISPDGRSVACIRISFGTPEQAEAAEPVAHRRRLRRSAARIGATLDRWPASITWAPAGDAVFVLADDHGATSVFRLDLATDEATLLAGDGELRRPLPDA